MAMCILLTVMMVSQVNTRGEIEKSYTSKCEFYCIWIIFQKKKAIKIGSVKHRDSQETTRAPGLCPGAPSYKGFESDFLVEMAVAQLGELNGHS